ncbi:hypothetical protein [Streptomyces carpinensis]|uniref:Integral-membrane protein n=1 Tax=Streptomyces carpinensis TaxID=66369 RepID=A0ABV1W1U6_9ACTN|nr:hypothetical protein [Streptomyces carpinensis]
MAAGRCARAMRAAVFAAVCVLLAALGHVMMSGRDVPAWAMAAGAAVTGGVGWVLGARERGLSLIVAVVVVAQTALHSAFSFAQSSSTASDAMDMPGMGAGSMGMSMNMGGMSPGSMDMAHMGMVHTAQLTTTDSMTHPMGWTSSIGMLAAHLLAALLSGLWLAHGEKAAFRILRAVAGWLAAPLRLLLALPLVPNRPRIHGRRRRSDQVLRLLLLSHAITSRGPPAGTAVA